MRKRARLPWLNYAAAALLAAYVLPPGGGGVALAQEAEAEPGGVEEIVVTGSYIPHTPEDAPLPVQVVDSEELFNQGSPSLVELVRTLGVSSGTDGETNQFQSNGLEGTANINMRGLGPGRTLVLTNGRRNAWSPYAISEQRQLFVDINMIPGVAIERVELLKDGAAATYGSDAIAGVANFITRSDFEGLEFATSYKNIADSSGDFDFGLIGGTKVGATNLVLSAGWSRRSELHARDRDWAIEPFGTRGNSLNYTGIPNPGSFFPILHTAGADGMPYTRDDTNRLLAASGTRDPQCAAFVGSFVDNPPDGAVSRPNCTYSYLYFDNLIEKEERWQIFGELTHEFSVDHSLSVELLYANTDVPEWKTSPSYPPQTLVDLNPETGRLVPANHPGLLRMAQDYPRNADGSQSVWANAADANCDPATTACNALVFFGRPFGVSGDSGEGFREYNTFRIMAGLEGKIFGSLNYTTSLLFTEANGERGSPDTYAERWSLAFRGLGGPNCNPATGTPGQGGCLYYNPFSNAIQFPQAKRFDDGQIVENPNYRADLANTPELRDWLADLLTDEVDSGIIVYDFVLSGETGWELPGGAVSFAAGAQWRRESYEFTPAAIADLTQNPCQTTGENERWRMASDPMARCDAGTPGAAADDYEGSGQFIFLAGSTPFDDDQDIIGVFGEIFLPFAERFEAQLSVRWEDYGGKVGGSVDPKLALRWQLADWLALRASGSTTFRGPTLNQLGGRGTTLSFVGAARTFKAVDVTGNPDLKSESAVSFNVGAIFEWENLIGSGDSLYISLDYWNFGLEDPIIREDFNSLIAAGFSMQDHDGDMSTPDVNALNGMLNSRFNISGCDPDLPISATNSCQASSIQRIRTNMINGPDMDTDGVDFALRYGFDMGPGRMEVSWAGTWINSFDVGETTVGAITIPAFDARSKLNATVAYLRPILGLKWNIGLRYEMANHLFNLIYNKTGSYEDRKVTPTPTNPINHPAEYDRGIEGHGTIDFHYNMAVGGFFNSDALSGTTFWLSAYNLADEDPPFARNDLNYDAYTHSAFGRIIKVGLRQSF